MRRQEQLQHQQQELRFTGWNTVQIDKENPNLSPGLARVVLVVVTWKGLWYKDQESDQSEWQA